ncbi:TetR/AcrR family transcriptional regulator [Porticoccaceae bacterium]|nr:TetR/AcrR family transcriptional regulator [Porticoccaceae bacterium]
MNSIISSNLMSPFSKGHQHQRKFQSILSEAAGLFNWQGSRATTLADIAGSMQLTKTCVYYYVKTKEDLIYQCYVSSCDMWLAQAQQANALEANGLEKIVSMVRRHFDQYVKALNGEAPHFAMLTEVSSLDDAHAADIKARWAEIFGVCEAMVKQGIEEGVIEELDSAVICSGIFAIPQWFPVWLNRSHAAKPEAVIDTVLDILINGLSAQHHEFANVEFPPLNNLSIDSFDRDVQNRMKREAFYRVGSIYFNQKGFKGTSLDEIASSLDVTKGAFYYHIKNKEELLYQCFNRTLDVEGLLLSKAGLVQATGLKKIELSLRYLLNVQFSEEGPLIRYRALPSLDEEHRKDILKATKANNKILGTYIAEGFEDGTLRKIDVDIAQNVLSGAVEASPELAEWMTDSEIASSGPELSATYFHLFINGLARRSNN